MAKDGLRYDFPVEDRIKQFAKRHGLQAAVIGQPNSNPPEVLRVWFGTDHDLAVEARHKYGAYCGGHYAVPD